MEFVTYVTFHVINYWVSPNDYASALYLGGTDSNPSPAYVFPLFSSDHLHKNRLDTTAYLTFLPTHLSPHEDTIIRPKVTLSSVLSLPPHTLDEREFC